MNDVLKIDEWLKQTNQNTPEGSQFKVITKDKTRVMRLSDGAIFSVGDVVFSDRIIYSKDKVVYATIKGFSNDNIRVAVCFFFNDNLYNIDIEINYLYLHNPTYIKS